MQFLYYKTVQVLHCHSAVNILQNGPVTVLTQCSSYTTKVPITVLTQCCSYTTNRSSNCIVTVQILYYKTVQLLYCHSAVPIHKTVQLLYCHSTVPILQNGPVTVLTQCNSYNKIVQLLYCHRAVPILQNGPVTVLTQCNSYNKIVQLLYCHRGVPILQNVPVTLLSQCSYYTTKRSSYCIVTVQFL